MRALCIALIAFPGGLSAQTDGSAAAEMSRFFDLMRSNNCVMTQPEVEAYMAQAGLSEGVMFSRFQTMIGAGGLEMDRSVPAVVLADVVCRGDHQDFARAVAPTDQEIGEYIKEAIEVLHACQFEDTTLGPDQHLDSQNFIAGRLGIDLPTDFHTAEAIAIRFDVVARQLVDAAILIPGEGEGEATLTFEGCGAE